MNAATSMTAKLESFSCSNPLAAMGAAVVLGIVIGMWRNGRR